MPKIDIDSPRYDQSTFSGRLKYYYTTVNPLNILASEAELKKAKEIVETYRSGKEIEGLSEEEVWKAKELYDSAFHPETGELMFFVGRMSFQVPGNMIINGFMMTFYKSTPAVIFWQWFNQTFNAIVNYTNRNASAQVSNEQLGSAYAAATIASVSTAVGFNKLVARSAVLSSGLIGRFVPIVAVAAANCVNIPLMRQQEIKSGIAIETDDGEVVGLSSNAAKKAISQVVPCRIGMAIPGMAIPGYLLSKLEKTAFFIKNPWVKAPFTVVAAGLCLSISTPFFCAIMPQRASIALSDLEPHLQESISAKFPNKKEFFFNKGL